MRKKISQSIFACLIISAAIFLVQSISANAIARNTDPWHELSLAMSFRNDFVEEDFMECEDVSSDGITTRKIKLLKDIKAWPDDISLIVSCDAKKAT